MEKLILLNSYARLKNRLNLWYFFSRRVAALQWEVKQLEKNARLYNEEESQIVRNSSKLVSVLNTFIR